MNSFSIKLKQTRIENKLSREEIAGLLDIPLRTYRSYESTGKNHREPDHAMLVKIADILNVSIDYLLGRE